MRFNILSATRFQRAASTGIGLLIIGLWSLGCGGSASRGPDSGGDAQPAADSDARAAMEVVRDYIDALNEGDLARAYDYWWLQTKADGLTFDKFQSQRANIAAVRADIGNPGAVRVTGTRIPVELHITYKDDSRECAKGTYVLWGGGAPTPRGTQWFIASSDIKEC